jgi:hypothetical protein
LSSASATCMGAEVGDMQDDSCEKGQPVRTVLSVFAMTADLSDESGSRPWPSGSKIYYDVSINRDEHDHCQVGYCNLSLR